MADLSSAAEAALNKLTADGEAYLLARAAWYQTEPQSDAEWEARERMKVSHETLLGSLRTLEYLRADDMLRGGA